MADRRDISASFNKNLIPFYRLGLRDDLYAETLERPLTLHRDAFTGQDASYRVKHPANR